MKINNKKNSIFYKNNKNNNNNNMNKNKEK